MDKAEYILGFILIFILPQLTAFLAVGCLVFIDLFTGVWVAVKKGGWSSIKSARLKDTVTKFVMYNVFIITCMIAETYLLTKIPFIAVALGIIATVETKSIFENIEHVLDIKIIRAFKELIHKGKKA
jgi:hypothetical protein